MIDKLGWEGTFIIECNGKKEVIKNRVMDAALDEIIKSLQDGTNDINIKYFALGTSNTPVSDTDTQLGNEIFRTQFTTQEKTNIGELTTKFVVLDTEAVGQIEEIGIFGGSTATSSPNTGVLISRILWSKNKSNEEINFTRIDRITRG